MTQVAANKEHGNVKMASNLLAGRKAECVSKSRHRTN